MLRKRRRYKDADGRLLPDPADVRVGPLGVLLPLGHAVLQRSLQGHQDVPVAVGLQPKPAVRATGELSVLQRRRGLLAEQPLLQVDQQLRLQLLRRLPDVLRRQQLLRQRAVLHQRRLLFARVDAVRLASVRPRRGLCGQQHLLSPRYIALWGHVL